jgi:transcriptional regulator with XRE-family HTH domain
MSETRGGTAVRTPTLKPTHIPMFCAARLRVARAAKGLTQEAMAARIGKTLSTYVRYELGLVNPPWEAFGAICVALDVTPGELIYDPRVCDPRAATDIFDTQ